MSARSPRPLVGLAAAALTIGLIGAPVMAYAEATATPTPTPATKQSAASSTPTATSTPSATAAPTTSPSPSASESADSATPSPSESQSAAASAEDASPTPSPDSSTSTGRTNADAVQAPAADQPGSEEVEAQAEQPAAITLTKSASPTRVSKIGQVITYRFTAVNTGSLTLDNVAITDDLEGLSRLSCEGAARLDEGDRLICTATLTLTQDWLDFGDIDNSATVFGEFTIEGQSDYVGANASARVAVTQKPAIALDASVSPTGTADAGDRLRYTATATNTGNVTLRGARITSSLDALDLDCDPSARATLSPGESIECTGRYRVSNANARKGRVSNELTARATGPYDDQQVSDDDTLRTEVTKLTADPGLADAGSPDGTVPVGLFGVLAVVAGAGLLRRGLRS
ncbi:MAG TPA: hypothetical protein VEX66_11680 [Microlunatus sp.]|nr:hypothetical protein [Microlunatus sp.]